LGCLPRSLPWRRALAMPSRVRWRIRLASKLGDHGEDLQEHPGERVVPVVHRPAEREADATGGKLPEDVQRIGHRAGEPVQLGDGQGVALADGGQGLVEAGPGAAGAGESLVDVDAFGYNAERGELLDLDAAVLFVGRAAGVSSA